MITPQGENAQLPDLPVAFASNAIYVLERNGDYSLRHEYERLLLPLLKNKLQNLHAEGIAQAAWALSNAGIYDQELWEGLANLAKSKDFDCIYVKNQRWSAQLFEQVTGSEHFFQSEISPFANALFFKGKIKIIPSNNYYCRSS